MAGMTNGEKKTFWEGFGTGNVITLLIQSVVIIVWATSVHKDVEFLMDQATKGDRFTATQGIAHSQRITSNTSRVRALERQQVILVEHATNHDDTAQIWIDQIKENTRTVRENNALLRRLLGSHNGGNHAP